VLSYQRLLSSELYNCIFLSEKLKLDRDFSKYNYLSLDSATVNGLDDAASFRTVRVSLLSSLPYSSWFLNTLHHVRHWFRLSWD